MGRAWRPGLSAWATRRTSSTIGSKRARTNWLVGPSPPKTAQRTIYASRRDLGKRAWDGVDWISGLGFLDDAPESWLVTNGVKAGGTQPIRERCTARLHPLEQSERLLSLSNGKESQVSSTPGNGPGRSRSNPGVMRPIRC